MGDYVFDKQKPPPLLVKALNYEKWGIGDIMRLPAGRLSELNTVLSYYHALMNYQSSNGRTVEWTKRNPVAWEMVSWVIAQRKGRNSGNRDK